MSKFARSEGFDWKSAEREIIRLIRAIDNVANDSIHPKVRAKEILMAWRHPTLRPVGHFAKVEEDKKLAAIRHFTRKLRATWRELDPELRTTIEWEAKWYGGFRSPTGFTSVPESHLLQFLNFGPELVERLIPAAERSLAEGEDIARRNYAEIRLVSECATVWEARTGRRPRSSRHKAFSEFLENVFIAVGINLEKISVPNTIRAWREVED